MSFFAILGLALSVSALPINTTIASGNYSLVTISARGTCSAGSVVCNGPTQFAICNPQQSLVFQAVAPGTSCVGGKIQQGTADSASSGGNSDTPSAMATAVPAIRPTSVSSKTVTVTSTSISTVIVSTSTSSAASSKSSAQSYSTSHSAAPSPTAAASSSSAAAAPSAPAATGSPKTYSGDGSPSQGWPEMSSWASFEALWAINEPTMLISCSQFSQPNNSPQEISDLKAAITSAAAKSGLDARYILAEVMQESQGCVRVPTTSYSVKNPGLLQTHAGSGTCNTAIAVDGKVTQPGQAQNPCPSSEIALMINQGVFGTPTDGLLQCFQQAGTSAGTSGQYYRASRIYNSGSIPSDGNLSGDGATSSYSSDIAGRLLGFKIG